MKKKKMQKRLIKTITYRSKGMNKMISIGHADNIYDLYNSSRKKQTDKQEALRTIEALKTVCGHEKLMSEVRMLQQEQEE